MSNPRFRLLSYYAIRALRYRCLGDTLTLVRDAYDNDINCLVLLSCFPSVETILSFDQPCFLIETKNYRSNACVLSCRSIREMKNCRNAYYRLQNEKTICVFVFHAVLYCGAKGGTRTRTAYAEGF